MYGAHRFVELFFRLLHSQSGHMDTPHKRRLDVAVIVNAHRFVRMSVKSGPEIPADHRAQQVSGADLIAALRLQAHTALP